jgi:hypothetical protein
MKTFLFFGALLTLAAAGSCPWDNQQQEAPDAGASGASMHTDPRIDALQARIELLETGPGADLGRYKLDRPTPPYGHSAMLLDTAPAKRGCNVRMSVA